VPIFSLTFGYISIANRSIIQIVQKLSELPKSYSLQVSGPALLFLLGMLVFYWLMVIMFEMRVFSWIGRACCCKGNRSDNGRASTVSSHFQGHATVDQDIVEEENRVQ